MAGRQYKIDDISFPSVTTVLNVLDKSSALMPWAVNMALEYLRQNAVAGEGEQMIVCEELLLEAKTNYRKVSQEALDIGSAVHDAIECYIKHGRDKTQQEIYSKPDLSKEQREAIDNAFLAFLEWYGENVESCIQAEGTVVSKEHGYAGTADFVGKFKDGRKMLIDWKTSRGFYSGYGKQVAAYKLAYEEMTGEKLDGCGVLRIDKETGLPEFKDFSDDQERKTDAFLKLLDFYYADKRRKLKNNPRVK